MGIFGSARGKGYSASRRGFSISLAIQALPFITLALAGTTGFGRFASDATARYGQVRGRDSADGTTGRKSQRPGDRLALPPGTSHLELAFDPGELPAPQRIRLQYRLDGVDDGWLDALPSHVATYSGIPPGSHTFHVRATNRDGVWTLWE
jgi:hypothetical protein